MQSLAGAGECLYKEFRLEFQVVELEYVFNKSLKINAICFNPFHQYEKEAVLNHCSSNLGNGDERTKISLLIIDALIKKLNLDKNQLRKLVIKNNKAFFILKV